MKISRTGIWIVLLLVLALTLACMPSTPRPALVFSPDSLPDAQAGVPYSVDIVVSQNVTPMYDARITEGSLPDGLTLELIKENSSVRISGTPDQSGAFSFTIQVACYGTSVNGQVGSKQYTLNVGEAQQKPLSFSPDTLADGQVGTSYDAEIQVLQTETPVGGVEISEGALPAGLTLELSDTENVLHLYGVPTEAGTFTFTVSVWCYGTNTSGQTGEKKYTLTITK